MEPAKIRTIFMTGLSQASNLLGRGGWEIKKAAYAAVILAAIVWLSIALKWHITTEWNFAFGLLLSAVTGGYLGGKKIGMGGPSEPAK